MPFRINVLRGAVVRHAFALLFGALFPALLMAAPAAPATISGAAGESATPGAVIRGEAFYRERIAVPPGVRLEVALLDVSRADAPSVTLAEVLVSEAGLPPYRFALPYDPARLEARHRYTVRARLLHGDRLLFTTDRSYPVQAGNAPGDLKLLLVKATGQRGAQSVSSASSVPPSGQATGADRDAHGCIASAGYAWCARDNTCARPWALLAAKGLAHDPGVFAAYCHAGK